MNIRICSAHEIGMQSQIIQEFYDQFWPRKIALSVDPFYQWQFIHPPASKGLNHCCVALDMTTEKLVGVMGVTPKPFYLNEQIVQGVELTTWLIHPEYQGKGIGASILEFLQVRYDVIIGMGISDMALPLYYRYGFRYLKAIPRYIKVFNWDSIKKYSKVAPLAIKMDRYWAKKNNLESYVLLPPEKNHVDFLHCQNQRYFNYFSRDVAHIRWRYADHPVFNYKAFVVAASSLEQDGTLLCFREETAVPNIRILHVVECIGRGPSVSSAICFIEQYAIDHHFDAVDFYGTSSYIAKFFLARGWFSTMDDESLAIPHLFHPIELRNPSTTSLIYWAKHNMVELCDLSKLHITKQDVDFDRPVKSIFEDD